MQNLLYSDVRNDIQAGDILAFTGGLLYGCLSIAQRLNLRLLQGLTPPEYVPAHVGIADWQEGRLMCVEQNVGGGQIVPVSQLMSKYQVVWCPLAVELDRDRIVATAKSAIGLPYSFLAAYRAGTQRTVSDKRRYCSGLVQMSLIAGGYVWIDTNPLPVECVSQPCVSVSGRLVLSAS